MKRSQELEKAVRKYLDLKNCRYISSKNQTVKCYKCQSFQQVRTQGFDFFVFYPKTFFCEVKTGTGRLSKSQKETRAMAEKCGIPYIEVHDNIDALVEII